MLVSTQVWTAALLLLAMSCAYAETHVVVIESMRFNPASLTVNRGDRVVWENKDLVPHTATSDTTAFDSEDLAVQAAWAYVAEKAGDYAYHCAYHPTMTARLIVR
jgi:plastocyanin